MTDSRSLNPAHESFVIVQTDDDEEQSQDQPSTTRTKSYDLDFTFVGGVYPSLDTANTAALSLAARKCNCEVPALTFSTSSTAFKHTATAASPLTTTSSSSPSSISDSSTTGSPSLGTTAVSARPQLIQHRSGDGRYSCRCTSASEDGGDGKGFKFEVRKIEVRPLGSRMGWNFSDDDA
ncbi:hypothetical protein FKW77_005026 [Venturia effusa]|uniref:Uncharacterized protein n=1 Tax=Venturia effusa TaxID=50376 RepID=A0A517LR80_9PEZI|nr:hypothetical protein FKW77_005026 [Venturia effusa]